MPPHQRRAHVVPPWRDLRDPPEGGTNHVRPVIQYNETPGRTKEQVLAFIEQAAAAVEAALRAPQAPEVAWWGHCIEPAVAAGRRRDRLRRGRHGQDHQELEHHGTQGDRGQHVRRLGRAADRCRRALPRR